MVLTGERTNVQCHSTADFIIFDFAQDSVLKWQFIFKWSREKMLHTANYRGNSIEIVNCIFRKKGKIRQSDDVFQAYWQ